MGVKIRKRTRTTTPPITSGRSTFPPPWVGRKTHLCVSEHDVHSQLCLWLLSQTEVGISTIRSASAQEGLISSDEVTTFQGTKKASLTLLLQKTQLSLAISIHKEALGYSKNCNYPYCTSNFYPVNTPTFTPHKADKTDKIFNKITICNFFDHLSYWIYGSEDT